jgi:hypothetical protein
MTFVSHWSEISTALGLEIQSPAEVTLPDGRIVNAPVLLKNFGYENGMMLFEALPAISGKLAKRWSLWGTVIPV